MSPIRRSKGQDAWKANPFAVIVGRRFQGAPELIFDRGLGRIIRRARCRANVVGPIEMDSVDFAVGALKVPLVVVLGHQNCGAVKATLAGKAKYPDLGSIIPLIESSLKDCEMIGNSSLVDAINCNVSKGVKTLKNAPTIAPLLKEKKVKVVGAYYEIATGKVTLIRD